MFPHIDPAFLEEILYILLPTFLGGAAGNLDAARQAARAALTAYDPQTEQELRLAAQITQYSFASLDAVSRSIDPDLPLTTVLRLRGNANAMQRSANQCQRTLERLRKERRQAQPAQATTDLPHAEAPTTEAPTTEAPRAAIPQPEAPKPATPTHQEPRTPAPDAHGVIAAPDPDRHARTAPDAHPPAYAEEGTVPWESMFLPLPPDAQEPPPRLRPAA
jgi:hypothetical protein